MPLLRVLLACPQMTMTGLWRTILSQEPGVELVGEASDAVDTLIKAGNTQATVVVIDLPSSGRDPGLCSHLLEENPQVKVVAVSQDGGRAVKYERGILKRQIKDTSPKSLINLFRSLWMDEGPVSSDIG